MTRKILGLDIGEKNIKAVLVIRELTGNYTVTKATVIDIEPGGLPEAIKKLFEDKEFTGSLCITSLPASFASFRNIKLPFKDKKRIRQTIAFELESLIPYSIDDVLIDYTFRSSSGQTEILVVVIPKAGLRDTLAVIEEHTDIAVVDISAVSIAARLIAKEKFGESGLLLDIGARDTVGIFVEAGQIIQVRHYAFGGEKITEAIAKAYALDGEDAEVKKKEGNIGLAVKEVSQVIHGFLHELKNTSEFLRWQGILERWPAKILLTGGGALCGGFREELSRFLSVPVEMVDILSADVIRLKETLKDKWNPGIMNHALALAIRPIEGGMGFNFKQREVEANGNYGQFKTHLRWVASIFLLILFLAALNVYLDYRYDRLRLEQMKTEIISIFRDNCPEVTRVVNPVQQLRDKIAELKKISLGYEKGTSEVTTLGLLQDISKLIPASAEILITNFDYDHGLIMMKGEARNFDTVNSIKETLSGSKYFKTVTISSTNLVRQGDKVEFELKLSTRK
jgi:Tfp pilus assembly PilM family ATPase/Tfp pilus assembly protein PilN